VVVVVVVVVVASRNDVEGRRCNSLKNSRLSQRTSNSRP
jgi:hypothetical protein